MYICVTQNDKDMEKQSLLLRIGSKLNEDFINSTDMLQMPINGNEKHVDALGCAMEDVDYLLWG